MADVNKDRHAGMTVQELIEKIRAEASRARTSFQDSLASQNARATTARSTEPASAEADAILDWRQPRSTTTEVREPLPPRSEYAMNDFLSFHDIDFVSNAYRCLLQRAPDSAGLQSFLNALREGRLGKIDILGRIRYSAEGRQTGVPVRGLAIPFAVRSLKRLPILGRLLGIAQYLWRLPELARGHERLETLIFQREGALRSQLETQLNLHYASLDDLQRRLVAAVGSLSRTSASLGESSRVQAAQLSQASGKAAEVARNLDALTATAAMRDEVEVIRRALGIRIDLLAHEVRAQPLSNVPAGDSLDEFYMAFENRFRGSRAEVMARLAVYVPVLREADAGGSESPILDLGCGRGDFLEVLLGANLLASGVDVSETAIAECRKKALNVVQADALTHLRELESDSVGAISAIHVVEHLPLPRVIEVLDEVLRVLRPGGVAIFETPNPENVYVGACTFYFDPTHQRPIPPATLSFMFENRGFSRVVIERLRVDEAGRRFQQGPVQLDDPVHRAFSETLDYAVLGYK